MTKEQCRQVSSSAKALGSAIVLQSLNDVISPKFTCKGAKYFEIYRKENKRDAINFLTTDRLKVYDTYFGLGLDLPRVKKLSNYRRDYLTKKIIKAKGKVALDNEIARNKTVLHTEGLDRNKVK